jgi:hypothetical protein
MLTISGKALGSRRPLFADWSLPIAPEMRGDGGVTLRKLIERVVREQVRAFKSRQADNQILRALTSRQIEAAAEKGKVTMGESDVGVQEVNEDAAVANAWQAFEDGIYLVVIDDVEQKQLDGQLYLNEESRVTFLRLTMLAGG